MDDYNDQQHYNINEPNPFYQPYSDDDDKPGPSYQPTPGRLADRREAQRVEFMRESLETWHDQEFRLHEQHLRKAAAKEGARVARRERAEKAARAGEARTDEERLAAEAAREAAEIRKAQGGGGLVGWITDINFFLRGDRAPEGGSGRGCKGRSNDDDDDCIDRNGAAEAGAGGAQKRQRSSSR